MSEFIKVYPIPIRKKLANMIKEAYVLRDECINRNAMIASTEIGRFDLAAHLLRAAMEKVAKEYCNSGILPFTCDAEKNKARNCRHLELKAGNVRTFFARASIASQKPGRVKYRPIIEYNIFTDLDPYEKDISIDTYLVNYGDRNGQFEFAGVGIPGQSSWLYYQPLDLTVPDFKLLTESKKDEILVEIIEEGVNNGLKDANRKK